MAENDEQLEKMALPIFDVNSPEPGAGNARIRFLAQKLCGIDKLSAQTAVWEAISWPKLFVGQEIDMNLIYFDISLTLI